MKRVISLLLVLVVVLGCVGLAACGGGDGGAVVDNGGAEPANGGEQPSNGNGGGDGNGGGETLTDILALGAGISSVKYDTVVSIPGADTFTMHVWLKGNKFKTESEPSEGMGTVISIVDLDAQVMYQYFPERHMAYKMTYDQETSTALTETQSVAQYNPTVLGSDTIDGKDCLVVEYSYGGETVKMWLWKAHGFPVRSETTTVEGTMVVEFKNIDFSNIPDSAFEIPEDVLIVET